MCITFYSCNVSKQTKTEFAYEVRNVSVKFTVRVRNRNVQQGVRKVPCPHQPSSSLYYRPLPTDISATSTEVYLHANINAHKVSFVYWSTRRCMLNFQKAIDSQLSSKGRATLSWPWSRDVMPEWSSAQIFLVALPLLHAFLSKSISILLSINLSQFSYLLVSLPIYAK